MLSDASLPLPNAAQRDRPSSGMAWAVRAKSQQPVYIGQLERAQKGLACDCVCPACKAPLQAVAVGLPSTDNRVPFFRHHNATQGPGCKHRVAELAALRLFAERGIIEIPAPRSSATVKGLSGKLYEKTCVGEAVTERVVGRRAISDVEVELTLESGRKVVLTLRGEQHLGELGTVHTVIQIHVADPDVAWMSPEEILAHARMTPRFLDLIAHPELGGLAQKAADEARQAALDSLDILPGDIHLPPGATKKQASESLLHWLVKDNLATLGFLRAPAFHQVVSERSPDGQFHSIEVNSPAVTLELSEVRWEQRFEVGIPDIACVAEDRRGRLGRFELLIEVAKTHKVSAVKLERLRGAGFACLELDVFKFSAHGLMHRSEVRSLVANDTTSKSWLCHPVLDALLADARRRVRAARELHERTQEEAERRASAERRRLEDDRERVARADRLRKRWAQGLTREQGLAELRGVLECRWAGRREVTTNGMQWDTQAFESHLIHVLGPNELPRSLTRAGGLGWRLSRILEVDGGRAPVLDFGAVVLPDTDVAHPSTEDGWLGLLHAVIEHLDVVVDSNQREQFQQSRERVMASLRAGEWRYARSGETDAMLASLFPEIAVVLERPLGTVNFARELKQQIELERAQRLAEEDARAAEERARLQALRMEEARAEAVALAQRDWHWNPATGAPASPELAFKFLALTRVQSVTEPEAERVRSAWQSKSAGQPLDDWLSGLEFQGSESVEDLMKLLHDAYIARRRK